MLVNSFMNVRIAKQFSNQEKVIVVCIAHMEQFLVHQFNKTKVVVKTKLDEKEESYFKRFKTQI